MDKMRPETNCGAGPEQRSLRIWRGGSRWHRAVWLVTIALICLVISLFYLFSYQQMGEIYESETRVTIVELKKIFLKNTVDNLIVGLEATRQMEAERHQHVVDKRYESCLDGSLSCDEWIESLIEDIRPAGDGLQWSALIWREDGALLQDSLGVFEGGYQRCD